MLDFFMEYMDELITSGWSFFTMALPLVIIYFVFHRIREIYREGDLLWVSIMGGTQIGNLALGFYLITQGKPLWLVLLIGLAGVALSFRISDRFMPKKKDTDDE